MRSRQTKMFYKRMRPELTLHDKTCPCKMTRRSAVSDRLCSPSMASELSSYNLLTDTDTRRAHAKIKMLALI